MLQVQFNQNLNTNRQIKPMNRKISFCAIEKTLLGIKPDAFEKDLIK